MKAGKGRRPNQATSQTSFYTGCKSGNLVQPLLKLDASASFFKLFLGILGSIFTDLFHHLRTCGFSHILGFFQAQAGELADDLEDLLDLDVGRAWLGFTAESIAQQQQHDILTWQFDNTVDTSSTVGIDHASLMEGSNGTSDLVLNVYRTGNTSAEVTLDWATADGSALAGVDYVASAGQLVFLAGEAEKHHGSPTARCLVIFRLQS